MRGHGQQFPAYRSDPGIRLAGIHQRLNEVGQQQDVGIQRQHPVAARKLDGLVLRRRKTHVFLVVVHLAAALELFEDVDGAVGGGVIDNDDLFERIPLGEHRFEAALDEAAAVVRNYRDRDEVVLRHEPEPKRPIFSFTLVP